MKSTRKARANTSHIIKHFSLFFNPQRKEGKPMEPRDGIISRVNAGSKGGSNENQDTDFTRSLPPGTFRNS